MDYAAKGNVPKNEKSHALKYFPLIYPVFSPEEIPIESPTVKLHAPTADFYVPHVAATRGKRTG